MRAYRHRIHLRQRLIHSIGCKKMKEYDVYETGVNNYHGKTHVH